MPRFGFGRLPGDFELTSTVDNALPLVFAGLGQAIVVLTGGLDLSVGGRSAHIDLAPNSERALYLRPNPGYYALQSYQVLWKITTRNGFYPSQFNAAATDHRLLGAFITPTYEVRTP